MYKTLKDLPRPVIDSLCRFLIEYSEGEGHKIVFEGVDGRKQALAEISEGIKQFKCVHS